MLYYVHNIPRHDLERRILMKTASDLFWIIHTGCTYAWLCCNCDRGTECRMEALAKEMILKGEY